MRFSQLDRIVTLEKGKSLTAVKGLALSEEYLQDHFPRFPIMPGVLMMESMFQASMWLVRVSTDFEFAKVRLQHAKSLKFQGFVQPGDSLVVTAEIKSQKENLTTLKVSGSVNGSVATSGRLVLDAFNQADREGVDPALDFLMNNKFRSRFKIMCDQLDPAGPSQHTPEMLVATN